MEALSSKLVLDDRGGENDSTRERIHLEIASKSEDFRQPHACDELDNPSDTEINVQINVPNVVSHCQKCNAAFS